MVCFIKIQSENIKKAWNIIYLNYFAFVWFVIFLNVIVLQFCESYPSNSVVLSLLPLICNYDNLTIKLYTSEKIATLMKGDFL